MPRRVLLWARKNNKLLAWGSLQASLKKEIVYENLWFRAGVTLQLNDDEVDTILKTGADDNGDMDIVENVVKTALQEGRFAFDGNSYFPEPVVESLIQAEGLPYAPSEPEFDMSRLGGFTLAKPAVNGDMLSRPAL